MLRKRLTCLSMLFLACTVGTHAARASEPSALGDYAADPPGAFAADRNFDMVKLVLRLKLNPDDRSVEGTATWTVRRLAPGALQLDAIGLTVSAADVDGAAARVVPGPATLTVAMPDTATDVVSTVTLHYHANPQNGLHWRAPGPDSVDTFAEVWSQGQGEDNRYWFPAYDRPDERFLYEGSFDVPEGWNVVTNSGVELPSYLVMVAAGPYAFYNGEGPVPVRAVVAPGTPEAWVRPVLDPLPDMMAWIGGRTGVPYPWGHYDQVFVQRFLYGGMENTSATIETDRMIGPPSVHVTRPWVTSVVAHELAHQWFGDLLTARTWRELWLNEGFATFFAADWEEHARRVKEGDATADAVHAAAQDGWRRASLDNGSLAGRWFLNGGGAARAGGGPLQGEANHNVYSKGAMVLNMLRVYLGEDTFWHGIRDYSQGHAHSSVDTIDLQRAMEQRSGKDLGWFFQQWTELPGVPKLSTSWAWSPASPGSELSITLHQTGTAYTLPIDVAIDGNTNGGKPTRAWMTGSDLTMTLPAPTAPSFVAIDPNGGLLVDWDQAQGAEAWVAQLRSGSAYSRLLALHRLAAQPAPSDDPMPAMLVDATLPSPLREAIADALGARRTCGPLLTTLTDPDPRMRLATAAALAQCADKALVPPLLARLTGAETNSDVRANLLRAVAALDPKAVLPAARKVLASRSADVLDPERIAASGAIALQGAPSDVPALLRAPVSRDLRTTGLNAAVRILQRQALGPARDALRAQIAQSATPMLKDLDLREVQAAVSILREVGDAGSIAQLEALARATTLPNLARSAHDAAVAIGARVDTVAPATPNEIDARLDALEAGLEKLRSDELKWTAP